MFGCDFRVTSSFLFVDFGLALKCLWGPTGVTSGYLLDQLGIAWVSLWEHFRIHMERIVNTRVWEFYYFRIAHLMALNTGTSFLFSIHGCKTGISTRAWRHHLMGPQWVLNAFPTPFHHGAKTIMEKSCAKLDLGSERVWGPL